MLQLVRGAGKGTDRVVHCETVQRDKIAVRDTANFIEVTISDSIEGKEVTVDLSLEKAYRLAAYVKEKAEKLNDRTNSRRVIGENTQLSLEDKSAL